MKFVVLVLLCIYVFSSPMHAEDEEDDGREAVTPEHLDNLLKAQNYEEFNRLMGIEVPQLSQPGLEREENSDPRFSTYLEHGDILLSSKQKEQARQAINYTTYPTYKWTHEIPYAISCEYNQTTERALIEKYIRYCNRQFRFCVRLVPYAGEQDYLYIFPGSGCYSYLGLQGKQQPLSLAKRGCIHPSTVCHELMHALGFMHEQCRLDRDDYIYVNFTNIPKPWHSQFNKVSASAFYNVGRYDCQSIMHYPQYHYQICIDPRVPAFNVLDRSCNASQIGRAQKLSELDRLKIEEVYFPCNFIYTD